MEAAIMPSLRVDIKHVPSLLFLYISLAAEEEAWHELIVDIVLVFYVTFLPIIEVVLILGRVARSSAS
jgi:hypothetical protein